MIPRASSQYFPDENDSITYLICGFSAPVIPNTLNYGFEIAAGRFTNVDSFKKHLILSRESPVNRTILDLPSMQQQYTWRVAYSSGKSETIFDSLRHFYVMPDDRKYQDSVRLRPMTSSSLTKDYYILMDNFRGIFDLTGKKVWGLPVNIEYGKADNTPRDLKITPHHSITFLMGESVFEIDYHGKILWSEKGDGTFRFHHEFTRLKNGHYLGFGNEIVHEYLPTPNNPLKELWIVPESQQPLDTLSTRAGFRFYKKEQMSTVVEFDNAHHIVRSLHISDYLSETALYYNNGKDDLPKTITHENSLYLDEDRGELYVGVRDLSLILKIKYPEGYLQDVYGPEFTPGARQIKGKGDFCNQHSCRTLSDGNLILFNNNSCNWPQQPSVVIFHQPTTKSDSLVKIWEYKCTFDKLPDSTIRELKLFSGGSVQELEKGALFVDMGGQYSKIFIINRNKDILWSALPEKWREDLHTWIPWQQYRCNIITRDELEQLIWASLPEN